MNSTNVPAPPILYGGGTKGGVVELVKHLPPQKKVFKQSLYVEGQLTVPVNIVPPSSTINTSQQKTWPPKTDHINNTEHDGTEVLPAEIVEEENENKLRKPNLNFTPYEIVEEETVYEVVPEPENLGQKPIEWRGRTNNVALNKGLTFDEIIEHNNTVSEQNPEPETKKGDKLLKIILLIAASLLVILVVAFVIYNMVTPEEENYFSFLFASISGTTILGRPSQ